MRTFLWQGSIGSGNAKVAWDQLCKPKAEGGLGIRSLITTNQALILKQLWRILQNDGTSIWVDWIQQNRLRHTTIWTFNRDTGSWGWKKMLKLRPLLQRGVVYKVGDGSSFNLWQDIWHDRGPLCLNYPRRPAVMGLPLSSTISSVLQRNRWCCQPRQTPTLLKLYPSFLQHTLQQQTRFVGKAPLTLLNQLSYSSSSPTHGFVGTVFFKVTLRLLDMGLFFGSPFWKSYPPWISRGSRGKQMDVCFVDDSSMSPTITYFLNVGIPNDA
ncbi:hypothetical protein Sango_3040900 [Sesamum angolense]|uniref:Reverse transcriptase zinc-binding domain-containing protein n=1 Tax=Sesamum angolense TaxID=2727404 RepID=A0AAE1TCF9_9LAMI|nr:hypothetical protein Sango_3040900 [Sesamum angolense]